MYCKHCGKQIDDKSTFCMHCGGKLCGNSTRLPLLNLPTEIFGQLETWKIYMLAAFALWIPAIILYFCNWFSVSIPYYYSDKFTIFNIANALYGLSEYFDLNSDTDAFINVIFYSAVAVTIILALIIGLSILAYVRKNRKMFGFAIAFSAIMAIFALAVIVVTSIVFSDTNDWVTMMADQIFNITATPYIILALSAISIVLSIIASRDCDITDDVDELLLEDIAFYSFYAIAALVVLGLIVLGIFAFME